MKIFQSLNNQYLGVIILTVSVILVSVFPHDTLFDESKVFCIHHYLFGFQCPLCGMTRAVYQFTHLQFASAVNYNAVVVLLPVYFVSDILSLFIRKNWLSVFKKIVFILILAGLVLLYLFRIATYFHWI